MEPDLMLLVIPVTLTDCCDCFEFLSDVMVYLD